MSTEEPLIGEPDDDEPLPDEDPEFGDSEPDDAVDAND